MAWATWRMRNAAVLGGKRQSIETFQAFFKKERASCQIRILTAQMIPTRQLGMGAQIPDILRQDLSTYSCYVDGSWIDGGIAGIGVYLLHKGKVVFWISKAIQAVNPTQAEAKALLEGYQVLIERANGEGVVFSDSKELVSALRFVQNAFKRLGFSIKSRKV